MPLLAACAGHDRASPPNVLLISIDTLRADRLGSYGATTVETPAIDRLARQGVRFANAYTPLPLTLPAHWTLHTGVQPWHHGIVDNGMALATPPAATLAERFAAGGYDTAAFVAAFVLHATFGLDRGFATYDDGPDADSALDQLAHATAPADERVGQALRWLQGRGQPAPRPFFVWLHLFDPHAPYQPPADFRARYRNRPYDGEVAFVDSQVARLLAGLEHLGVASSTLVVVTGDHGESLGEHGEQTHGVLLYDATLRIPLVFRLPGSERAGTVRSDAATLADIAPTLLALAGLQPDPKVDGRDLFATVAPTPRLLGAISESPRRRLGWAPLIALREADWKYIAAPRPELYHFAEDPGELSNRLAAEPRRGRELARGAADLARELWSTLAATTTVEPSAEQRAALAALGYVGGPNPASRSPADGTDEGLPDPKDVIASLGELDATYQLLADGKLEAAAASFRRLVDRVEVPPAAALEGLARIARLRGLGPEAEATYRRLLAIEPTSVTALAQLVLLAHERQDEATAIQLARELTALVPRDPAASRLLATSLAAAGDPIAAEAEWQRGLAMAPHAGWLRLAYARFLVDTRQDADAEREITRLLAEANASERLLAAVRELDAARRTPGG